MIDGEPLSKLSKKYYRAGVEKGRKQDRVWMCTISVIGRENLLANKRAVGRPQDLRDARAIERAAVNAKKTGRRR